MDWCEKIIFKRAQEYVRAAVLKKAEQEGVEALVDSLGGTVEEWNNYISVLQSADKDEPDLISEEQARFGLEGMGEAGDADEKNT